MMREVAVVNGREKTSRARSRYLAAGIVLCVVLTMAFLSFSLKAVLVSQVNQAAERDLQEVASGFATHVYNIAYDNALSDVTPEEVLRSFIDRHPVDPNVTLLGVTPDLIIQAEHAARKLHAGDELISKVGGQEKVGVVDKLDGPTYWATVDITDASSTLLIVRFAGADRARVGEIVQLLTYLAGAGAIAAWALWWAFRLREDSEETNAVFFRRIDAAELALDLEGRTGLQLSTPVAAGIWVKADVDALATALEALAHRIDATELGANIHSTTVTLWVRNPTTQWEQSVLNTLFEPAEMSAVRESTALHHGAAWAESTQSAGTIIGIDIPTVSALSSIF